MAAPSRQPINAAAGTALHVNNSIVQGNNYVLNGSHNDVLGDGVTVFGDNNLLLGRGCRATGRRNVDGTGANRCRSVSTANRSAAQTQRAPGPAPQKPAAESQIAHPLSASSGAWCASVLDVDGESDFAKGGQACCVCLERKPDICFDPCHHAICCRACSRALFEQGARSKTLCPLCQAEIKLVCVLYF